MRVDRGNNIFGRYAMVSFSASRDRTVRVIKSINCCLNADARGEQRDRRIVCTFRNPFQYAQLLPATTYTYDSHNADRGRRL